MSTGASREAPVDNECLGKSRQVGDDGKSWSTGYWEVGRASLGKSAATGNPDLQAIGSWARQV